MSREGYRMWTTTCKNMILHRPNSPVVRSHSHSTPREAPLPLHNSGTWCRLRTRARPGAWIGMRQFHLYIMPEKHGVITMSKSTAILMKPTFSATPRTRTGPQNSKIRWCSWFPHALSIRTGPRKRRGTELFHNIILVWIERLQKIRRNGIDGMREADCYDSMTHLRSNSEINNTQTHVFHLRT